MERPVRVEKDPLVVSFALVIQQIIDLVRLQYPTSPGELLLVNKADAL